MGFALPAALALLGLAIPILLLYLLRLRREERVVSSIYLWQQAVRDIEANAPWQRLRRNLLLFLQLAALAALVLALAGPYVTTTRVQGDHLILVVDVSASMASTDIRPDRLEAARREALRLAAGLPPGGQVTLVTAGGTPRVLLAHSPDRALLRTTLERLEATAGHSDLTPALRLAATLAAESTHAEIALLSDGRVSLEEEILLPAAFRFVSLGNSDANQGIVACSLEQAAGQFDLFVRVHNFAPVPAQRRLDLYADGVLLTARHLDIPARGDIAISLELGGAVTSAEARLDGRDDLPADDVAWAVPPQGSLGQVVLVTEGNRFLQTGLGFLPGIQLTLVPPAGFPVWWATAQEQGPPPTLFLFDAYVPPELPSGNLFLIAPPASTALFQVEGALDAPETRPAREDEPLLRYVDVSGLGVRQSRAITLPPWARAVLVDESGWPLLFFGQEGGRRVAVLAFDLHDSDLPLRVAFPILLTNLYDALSPGGAGSLPVALSLGEPLVVEAVPQVEEIVVVAPDGNETTLIPTEGRSVFEATGQPGVYEVIWRGEGRELDRASTAVSLLSDEEGDISPRKELPQVVTSAEPSDQPELSGRLQFSQGLAALALAILLVEWGLAHRGGLVDLVTALRRPLSLKQKNALDGQE